MCGRFTQHHKIEEVASRFAVQHRLFSVEPRYNIAPTQTIAAIVTASSKQERYLDGFQWGLVPTWAKDVSVGNKMINARAETLTEKPAFQQALKYQRCIIPADGFYEWRQEGKVKQPIHFRRKDGDLFGFAGLWAEKPLPDGERLMTCTIITTAANSLVAPVHDRMPVILGTQEAEETWLNSSISDPAHILSLLQPFPETQMEGFTVDRRVGSPANDFPELLTAAHQ